MTTLRTILRRLPASLSLAAALVALVAAASAQGATPALWSTTSTMAGARSGHTATVLNNGKVLVIGSFTRTAELYDPATGSWTPAGGPTYSAYGGHTATLLQNGKVLVAGGVGESPMAKSELYDPATNTWGSAADMASPRYSHTATLLPNGKVLVAGGQTSGTSASAELYDPATNSWAPAAAMAQARSSHTATPLANGKVLVQGGWIDGFVVPGMITRAELYDPATNTWASAGSTAMTFSQATRLPSGKVLVTGGAPTQFETSAETRLYDPQANSWTSAEHMGFARRGHTATLLANGKVLVAGGQATDQAPDSILAVAELYDPAADAWSRVPNMNTARRAHTASLLSDGRVLVAGGDTPPNAAYTAASELFTPSKSTPDLAIDVSPRITLGSSVSASATLTGAQAPTTGTMTFQAFWPGDNTCTGAAAFTSSVAVAANGTAASSPFTPGITGSYRWSASYSGDPGNQSVSVRCDQSSKVERATPAIVVSPSGTVGLGGQVSATATVTGRVTPQPGALMDIHLYGPDDSTCRSSAVYHVHDVPYPVSGAPVASGSFTPTRAGTYYWTAEYSGDANNEPARTACNTTGSTVMVARGAPSVTATSSGPVTLGGAVSASVAVSGRVDPQEGATVDVRLYGPGDATCSAAPVYQSAAVGYPASGGSFVTGVFTPSSAGTYRWVARYNGDANNAPATSPCDGPGSTVTVGRAATTASVSASGSVGLGGAVSATAAVSGRVSPIAGATIDLRLYGPGDSSCSATPAFRAVVDYPASGGPVASGAFTPVAAGTYRWTAAYSGDPNNLPATSACGSAGTTVTVDRAVPTLTASASQTGAVGGTVTDSATVSGRANPLPGAVVDFRLYGPGDSSCSTAPVFQALGVAYPVSGGAISSGPFTPTVAGTYRWVAVYSGDANNQPVGGTCGDSAQTVVVGEQITPPPPPPPPPGPPPPPPPADATPPPLQAPPPAPASAGPTATATGFPTRRTTARSPPTADRPIPTATGSAMPAIGSVPATSPRSLRSPRSWDSRRAK